MSLNTLDCAASRTETSRSFYSSTVAEFLATDCATIVGQLARRHAAVHASAVAKQVHAWETEIELLRSAFEKIGPESQDWWILLEMPLLRLGKRIDAILLIPGIVAVIEFKIGASDFKGGDRIQTERYACSLRDFHEASQSRLVVPILCAEKAPDQVFVLTETEGVAKLIEANAATLGQVFTLLAGRHNPSAVALSARSFDASPYRPTPTIVEAAQAIYAGHEVSEIGRGDAADAELRETAASLRKITADAETYQRKVICFVTAAEQTAVPPVISIAAFPFRRIQDRSLRHCTS
ncbi:hypothetical protein [Ensifer aridi]|uniref:hypothetical protein n=1 Tax=Ensifer aridi TaxID=1708715 RepID=UPI00111C9156|nr:hypothetical protein [Ensifer aridi]